MRVLVVGMTDNPGGMESVIMGYFRKIDRAVIQFDFLVTCPKMAYEDEALDLGGRVFHIHKRGENVLRFHRELEAFMTEHAPEYAAIWVNLCNLVNVDFLKAAKRHRIAKRILHCHNAQNIDAGLLRSLMHDIHRTFITRYATDFWTCSEDACGWFYPKNIKQNPRYRYIPNSIDVTEYAFDPVVRTSVRKSMGWGRRFVIANVGRLHAQKNQTFLIHALAGLLRSNDRYCLALIGDGVDRPKLESEVNELGLQDAVEFLGVRDDVQSLYQGADVFVLPSLYEGVSIALLEAQANGLPCLLSDTLSQAGIVNNNVRKLGIEKRDMPLWATSVAELAESTDTRVDVNAMPGSVYDINCQVKNFVESLEK